MSRQLNLNVFVMEAGHHEAAWRHPGSPLSRLGEVGYFQEIARKAEAARYDAVFIADVPALMNATGRRPAPHFEPITLLSAVATATERIGLIGTASTTFHDPYTLARLFSSLDHISGGRAGWNIVTTWNPAVAPNYGREAMPDAESRYARAREFVDVVTKLWDSWEDDALVGDRETGFAFDPEKVHAIDHAGGTLRVKGPLGSPRSPQGRPVYVQAGSSDDGRAFAAQCAEAIFTAHQTLGDAQEFYADIKARTRSYGRNPDHIKVLPGLSPFVGSTEREARDLYDEYNDLTSLDYGLRQLSNFTPAEIAGHDLDAPVPVSWFTGEEARFSHPSRTRVIRNIVERERPTLRELLHRLAGARGHNVAIGTPTQLADLMQTWFEQGAADGFNIMPPALPDLLDAFSAGVIPILQDRGLFRTEYAGTTLRDHYGLPRPDSQYTELLPAAVST